MFSNMNTLAAVLASAPFAHAIGSAVVRNACTYEVTMCNVPAADGGYSEIDKVLSPNDTYTQEYTQLSNGNGWSIKLSKDTALTNILQYEYTFHDDGTIWYDLSCVNGNPWDGNWEITAEGAECTPKQAAYRYATDDAYGMQACSDDATITVTLCSGEDQNDGVAASISSSYSTQSTSSVYQTPSSTPSVTYASSYDAPSSSAEATSTEAFSSEASSTEASSTKEAASSASSSQEYPWHYHPTWWNNNAATSATPTTLATSAVVSTEANGATVTNIETVVETVYATATAYAAKREERHAGHRHGHPHFRA